MNPAVRRALLSGANNKTAINLNFANGIYSKGSQRFGVPSDIPGWSFTRASTKTALSSSGAVVSFGSGVPAITDLGLLIEEARTNLLLWSQAIDNAAWFKGSATVAADSATAPDGTLTADVVTFTGGAGANQNFQQSGTSVVSSVYTFSIWMKGSGTVQMDSPSGSGSIQTFTLTSSWQRFAAQYTATGTSITLRIISAPGNTAASVTAWGAQIELGSTASSYIPTTSSTATRAADLPLQSGLSATTAQGSLKATWTQTAQKAQASGLIAIDAGDATTNRVQAFLNTTGKIGWRYSTAGTDQVFADGATTIGAGSHKLAVSWSATGFVGYVDGVQDISVAITPGSVTLDTLDIGVTIGTHAALNDTLKTVVLYSTPMSNAQMQAATQ